MTIIKLFAKVGIIAICAVAGFFLGGPIGSIIAGYTAGAVIVGREMRNWNSVAKLSTSQKATSLKPSANLNNSSQGDTAHSRRIPRCSSYKTMHAESNGATLSAKATHDNHLVASPNQANTRGRSPSLTLYIPQRVKKHSWNQNHFSDNSLHSTFSSPAHSLQYPLSLPDPPPELGSSPCSPK